MVTGVEADREVPDEDGLDISAIESDTYALAAHYWSEEIEDEESDNPVEDYGDRFMKMTMANFPNSASSVKEYRRRSFNYQQILASKPGDFKRLSHQNSKRRSSKAWSAISTIPSETSAKLYSNMSTMKDEVSGTLQQLMSQLSEEKIYRQELQEQVANLNHQMRKLQRRQKAKPEGLGSSSVNQTEKLIAGDYRSQVSAHDYDRLGLDLVDRLNSTQLANIVKNTVLLLNVPLDRLEVFIPALARILDQEDIFMDFANKLHQEIFDEPITYGSNTASTKKCLERMLKATRQFNKNNK
ncbi:hypothetical protein TRVA0_029S01574 [Trichomonascus vanleenenianus]|uniref:uncharacterized protein n=1 Tax=Trichomonascus vanleenenianus TaxID=2268995 RepID=UPI003ECAA2B1